MKSILLAAIAIFGQLEAFLDDLLVLVGMVSNSLADRAFQLDHVVLGHSFGLMIKS